MFLVFLVKLPVFGVHLWLPKAHVEAPVSGSMLLAGVLLKLGGYGFLRFVSITGVSFSVRGGYFFRWGLLGGLFCCFICLRQVDLKALVAYSSVCHMGMALMGILRFVCVGMRGGVYILIGHGLCSSCLFYILYVFYGRFHRRRLILLKGCLILVPLMGWWWFIFVVLNMGVPPSLGFFSEVFIVIGAGLYDFSSYFWVFMFLLMSGVFRIYLYVRIIHGGGLFHSYVSVLQLRECLICWGHLFPSFFLPLVMTSFF